MFNTLKKVINLESKSGDKKVVPSNDTNHSGRTVPKNNARGFAGSSADEIKRGLESTSGGLATAQISEDAKRALDNAKGKEKNVTTYSNSSISETVATLFSEGDTDDALNRLRTYINENKGQVEKRYWFMLLDIYQTLDDEKSFEKVALLFANSFGTSPPSWIRNAETEKRTTVTGKNIIILEQKLVDGHNIKFKEFLKAAKDEKFCRINASQTKWEQSDFVGIFHFYKLLVELRKNRVKSVLMGDNNLIAFCSTYVKQDNPKMLKEDFLAKEQELWLLFLELLQWKGKQAEFEELSFEYAMKFELSPPDWDKDGLMTNDKTQDEVVEVDNEFKLEKILTYNNIDSLFEHIKSKFETQKTVEVDMSQVSRIDFASAGSITHFIQEVISEDASKELVFINPNEMIIVLFEMLGINEFVTITKINQ